MIRSAFNAVSEPDEGDIADKINEYFEDFEYKVYTNRYAQIDKQIPFLIIRKFKRLFEIWDENIIFSKFLEGDSFREIFTLMYNVFGKSVNKCSTTDCYLECELCGEEIVLRNNDPEYSYRLHEMSKYHLEFIRNLKAVRSQEEVDVIFSQTTNEEGTFLECHLCWVSISILKRNEGSVNSHLSVMESHQHDEKHQANMDLYNSNKNHIKVYNVEDKLYACSACEEIYHVDLLMDHLKNSTHRENCTKEKPKAPEKKNIEVNNNLDSSAVEKADFEVFKINMKLIRVVDDVIKCVLCESNLNSVYMVVEHLTSKEHTENLEEYMRNPKPSEEANRAETFHDSQESEQSTSSTGKEHTENLEKYTCNPKPSEEADRAETFHDSQENEQSTSSTSSDTPVVESTQKKDLDCRKFLTKSNYIACFVAVISCLIMFLMYLS